MLALITIEIQIWVNGKMVEFYMDKYVPRLEENVVYKDVSYKILGITHYPPSGVRLYCVRLSDLNE